MFSNLIKVKGVFEWLKCPFSVLGLSRGCPNSTQEEPIRWYQSSPCLSSSWENSHALVVLVVRAIKALQPRLYSLLCDVDAALFASRARCSASCALPTQCLHFQSCWRPMIHSITLKRRMNPSFPIAASSLVYLHLVCGWRASRRESFHQKFQHSSCPHQLW